MPQAKRVSKGKRTRNTVSVLGHRRGVLGSVDRRIASGYTAGVSGVAPCRICSRYTLAEYGAVSDPLSSMRRKSPTSAWRRFISSTKTTSEIPSRAYNSLFEAAGAAAAADMAAEAAAFEAAAAAFEAAAGAFEAARAAVEAAALAFEAAEAAASALAAAVAAGAAAAAVGAGDGAAAAACHGEAAPSARRKRLAITLTEAGACRDLTRFGPGNDLVCSASRVMRTSCVPEEQPNRWRTYRETLAGELDDGALAENTPCAGVRSCGNVRVLTS